MHQLVPWRIGMILCFDCDRETKHRMDSAIKSGSYSDYGELIALAVNNLLLIEKEVKTKGGVVFGEKRSAGAVEDKNFALKSNIVGDVQSEEGYTYHIDSSKRLIPLAVSDIGTIPKVFLLANICSPPPTFAPQYKAETNLSEVFTIDRWLFGQYNKLLPLKVNCRGLASIISRSSGDILLDVAAKEITNAAVRFREYLVSLDFENKSKRGDMLSIAFPTGHADIDKSKLRYSSQFIGSVAGANKISGLLFEYKFANIVSFKPNKILLTQAGWDFALLANPILDDMQNNKYDKFSIYEKEFLIRHIKGNIPVERFTFNEIIKDIIDGAISPEKLDEALYKMMRQNDDRSFSRSFLSSQRSGAMSRMVDIGLIERNWSGKCVTYSVTEYGQKFLRD